MKTKTKEEKREYSRKYYKEHAREESARKRLASKSSQLQAEIRIPKDQLIKLSDDRLQIFIKRIENLEKENDVIKRALRKLGIVMF